MMRWSPRQQALLKGMGLRLWSPAAPLGAAPAAPLVDQAAESVEALLPNAPRPVPGLAAEPEAIEGWAAREPMRAAPVLLAARAERSAPAAPGPRMPAQPQVSSQKPPQTPPEVQPPAQFASAAGPASAVASMDWPALREAVASCQACSLCESRSQTVFGVGHTQAHWMVVGEAPGEQEDLAGEPFVGPAGQLLDNMLQALGLSRQPGAPEHQVFIANTLKCRPPRNRNPSPEELAQCAPFLARQVALVQPRVILAMGRFAIQQLLGTTEAVGRLRGRVHAYQGVPVVVSYHPAYLLRQPADKAKAWEDLCLAASLIQQGG